MIRYYVTFLGNNGFQTSESFEANDFNDAFKRANDMFPAIQSLTTERVRIGTLEEYEHFALDRVIVPE